MAIQSYDFDALTNWYSRLYGNELSSRELLSGGFVVGTALSGFGGMGSRAAVVIEEVAATGGESFLYRGVSAGHPALSAALEGRVVPGNVAGSVSAEAHNLGGVAANSPFTSWSRSLDVATFNATKSGPGGVILRFPTGAPPSGAGWSWAWSPDVYMEEEVLLRGVREGATVIAP